MKRVIAIFTLCLILPTVACARDWTGVVARVSPSLAFLKTDEGTCTAFSINKKLGYFMTAGHCMGEVMLVNEVPATVVFFDESLDVLVLKADLHLPELSPSLESKAGEEYGMMGFAYGLPGPLFKAGNIASTDLSFKSTPIIFIDNDAAGGMSGGPEVNTRGKVIGVISKGDGRFGLSVRMDAVYEATKAYWNWKSPQPLPEIEIGGSNGTSRADDTLDTH